MSKILLLSSDLMITSQISAAAGDANAGLQILPNISAFEKALEASPSVDDQQQPPLVILDMGTRNLDLTTVVAAIRGSLPNSPIVAFGPHVNESMMRGAAEAGCDRVMSRGEFVANLSDIVSLS